MNDPITKLMAIGAKTTRYTGIKFLTHSEAFAFVLSPAYRWLEGKTMPGGKDEFGVKFALSCKTANGWTR